MPKTTIKIKTWRCPDCDYAQDFDPNDIGLMALHFPNVKAGYCPACYMGQCPDKVQKQKVMVKASTPEKKMTVTIMGEENIESEITGKDEKMIKEAKPKMTEAEKTAYRNKRKQDIAEDIVKAKLFEDK